MVKSNQKDGESTKFMQVLAPKIFARLAVEARKEGITVQELIRARIIPDWIGKNRKEAPEIVA